MRKDNYQDFQGNDQYEGFCVDMLRELADILKFSFKIKLVDDGLYGAPEPNGSWTGMVGELINRVSTLLLPLSRRRKKKKRKHAEMFRAGVSPQKQRLTLNSHEFTHTHTHAVAPNHNSAVTSRVSNCPQRGVSLLSRTKADFVIPQKRVGSVALKLSVPSFLPVNQPPAPPHSLPVQA